MMEINGEALSLVNNSIELIQNGVGLSKKHKVYTAESTRLLQKTLRTKGYLQLNKVVISGLTELHDTFKPEERTDFVGDMTAHFLGRSIAPLDKLLDDYVD